MNKKGFTLIELLAVIVVLAIILLIAMPIVLNVINDARQGAFNSTGYGLVKAAENEHMRTALEGGTIMETTYNFAGDVSALDFSGEAPTHGTIFVAVDGTIEMAVTNGAFCAVKESDSTEVKTYTWSELQAEAAYTAVAINNITTDCNVATLMP